MLPGESYFSSLASQLTKLIPLSEQAQHLRGFQNGLLIARLYSRHLKLQWCLTILLCAHFVMSYAYVEMEIGGGGSAGVMLWGVLGTSAITGMLWFLCLVACAGAKYVAGNRLAEHRGETTASAFRLLPQILVHLVQPYPMLDSTLLQRSSRQGHPLPPMKLNHFLFLISFLNWFFILRGMLNLFTHYSTPRATRITRLFATGNNLHFQTRALFRQHPIITITSLYLCSVFIFATFYRILEAGINPRSIQYQQMGLWLAMVTMTTVGYGDVTPVTSYGSVVTMVCGYMGVIVTSLFVSSISVGLELQPGEKVALLLLKRLQIRQQLRVKSGQFVSLCVGRKWREYKGRTRMAVTARQMQVKRELCRLRQDAKYGLKQTSFVLTYLEQQFRRVQMQIGQLMVNYEKMVHDCTEKEVMNEKILSFGDSFREGALLVTERKFKSEKVAGVDREHFISRKRFRRNNSID